MTDANGACVGSAARAPAGWRQGVLASLVMSLPLVAFMSLPAAMPVLVRHFQGARSATILVPMLATAPSACIALLAPLAGLLADRFGCRRTALISVAAFTAAGAAPLLTDDLALLVVGRVLLGLANAGLMTIGSALLADYFAGDARRKWLGFSGLFGSAAITIALVTGGILSSWNWRGPLLVPFVGLPILLLSVRYLFEPLNDLASEGSADPFQRFPWVSLGVLVVLTLLSAIWFYIEAIHIGLLLDQIGIRPPSLIALISAIISIGYPTGAMIYSRVTHRWSERALFVTGCLSTGCGLVGLGLARAPMLIILFGLLQQIGGGLMLTLTMHQCQERFAFRHRARAMGAWSSAFFAGQFASPIVVGTATFLAGGMRAGIASLGLVAVLASVLLAVLLTVDRLRNGTPDERGSSA